MTPRYKVLTYDWDRRTYTPQVGLSVPSVGITLAELRQAVRELKRMGYDCHRVRDSDGVHRSNDSSVLIERIT